MTYDQFVQEAGEVAQAYQRAYPRSGRPSPGDFYHCAWRRLREGYSHAGVLWAIAHGDQRPDPMPRDASDPVPPDPTPHVFGGRLRREGRFFVHDHGTFRPIFASALTLLAPGKPLEGFLAWAAETGFNGVRVFSGEIPWANQTREGARERLPDLLTQAQRLGLYVEVTALTDTQAWSRADIETHVREVAEICRAYDNTLLELANEPYHGVQNRLLYDPAFLVHLGQLANYPLWAMGAANQDELTTHTEGSYVTVHLDRSRERWNQVRRVRELEMLSGTVGKPVMNNEPIGAAEVYQPGRRLNEPLLFAGFGVLNRIFEAGGIFHFEDGLHCTLPVGPLQQEAAELFVEGSLRIIDTEDRLSFRNTGWTDSPVRKAALDQTLVRAYTGLSGDQGYTVLVGRTGDPQIEWQLGWQPVETLWDLGELQVLRIRRQ